MQSKSEAAGAITPVALIFLGGLIGGAAVNTVFPEPILSSVWIQVAGLVSLGVGIGLLVWARATFRRHQTALMPWTPSTALVKDGPYALSRNPIYLAFGIMYLGAAFVFNSLYILTMLVFVLVLFDLLQIPREERYLQTKFGEEFSNYKAKVRRWF